MTDLAHPIDNPATAKAYFQAKGCSHAHMSREYVQRHRECHAIRVSMEQDTKQTEESLEQLSRRAAFHDTAPQLLWGIHSDMADLTRGLHLKVNGYPIPHSMTQATRCHV